MTDVSEICAVLSPALLINELNTLLCALTKVTYEIALSIDSEVEINRKRNYALDKILFTACDQNKN